MIIPFFITSFIITFSVFGYGLLGYKILNLKEEKLNFGLNGILGLFFLSIISSYSHILFPHNYTHNLIIILVGICLIFILKHKYKINFKIHFRNFSIIFTLLFIAFIFAKTNEDYSYYHLPNSLQFAQQKLQFGLGNLNHGFKHISSLFMLKSLNYVPYFEHYLFNLTNFIFLVFLIQFIITEIYYNRESNTNFSLFFLTFFLILFLVKFSRIAEYGADIAGQIIMVFYLFFIIELLFNYDLDFKNRVKYLKLSLILLVFAITTKFILFIYSLYFLLIFFLLKNKISILKKFFEFRFFIILSLPVLFFLFFNFSSTGCVIYPIEFTCFSENFNWTLTSQTIDYLNFHYEVWSKGGKGPSFEVENQASYINSFNWIPHWISVYFFNKVSDYILVVFLITLIFTLFFIKEIFVVKKTHNKFNSKFILFYLCSIFIFLLWFFNFPTLRYAGYVIVFLLIISPFIYIFNDRINLQNKSAVKKISVLFMISFTIFFIKNSNRIYNELNIPDHSHHNFKNFPLYWDEDKEYKKIFIDGQRLYQTTGKCWSTPSVCVRSIDNLKISEYKNYIFYSIR